MSRVAVALTVVSISWLLSGLLLNLMQLTAFLLIRPFSLKGFRKVNYLLTYCMWSPLVAIAEHVAGFRVRLFFRNQESMDRFGKEHVIAVANHSFEVDWLFLWLAIDKFSLLSSAKAMVKKVIRTFPVMGWSYLFGEFVFLERDWRRDEATLRHSMDNFITFPDPVTILMFCEGTRFTPAKFATSNAFAVSRGLQPFRHHLVPRAKGFVCCVKHLHQVDGVDPRGMPAVYNVQIAFPSSRSADSGSSGPTFLSLLRGEAVQGDVYLERISIESIPDDAESFLTQLYRSKDELMDQHQLHGEFPGCIKVVRPPRLLPLLNLIIWPGSSACGIAYIMWLSFVQANLILFYSVAGLLLLTFAGFMFLMRSTRAKRGSSYGSSAPSSSSANDATTGSSSPSSASHRRQQKQEEQVSPNQQTVSDKKET